ncbi:MAG: DUF2269 family protein [Thermomicrobiales bacterium]
MNSLYLLLEFVHVSAVIVWLGGFVTLALLNARLARSGETAAQAAMARQSERFGRTVIGPAMGVALLAGLWMAGQFGIPFTAAWVVWGLIGFVGFIALGVVGIGRIGAELGALAQTASPNDPRVAAARRRMSLLTVLSGLLMLSVVWAMVFKPTF